MNKIDHLYKTFDPRSSILGFLANKPYGSSINNSVLPCKKQSKTAKQNKKEFRALSTVINSAYICNENVSMLYSQVQVYAFL